MKVRLFLTIILIISLLTGCLLTLGPETDVALTITLDNITSIGDLGEESWGFNIYAEVNEEETSLSIDEPIEIICSSWDQVHVRFHVYENVVVAPRRGRRSYSVFAGRVLNEGPISATRVVTAHQLVGNQPDVDWRFDVTLSAAER